jgi:hypothetical protein
MEDVPDRGSLNRLDPVLSCQELRTRFDLSDESHRRPNVYARQDSFYSPNADKNLMELVTDTCVQCVMLRMANKALRLADNEEDFDGFTAPNISTIRIRPGIQH